MYEYKVSGYSRYLIKGPSGSVAYPGILFVGFNRFS